MALVSVMVLLNNLTLLLSAKGNNRIPDSLESQFEWLYSRFEVILRFLTYREKRTSNHRTGWQIIVEIRDLAHQSQYVVDTNVHDLAKHRSSNIREPFFPDFGRLYMDVEVLIHKIRSFYGDKFMYGIEYKKDLQVSKLEGMSRTGGWKAKEEDDDDEVVGFNVGCQTLVNQLIDMNWKKLGVIVIQEEGGLGKSTMATKVYNDSSIKDNFTTRGWVLVSKNYSLRKLLLRILSDFTIINEDICNMEEWELKREITKQLSGRRYLIVMDDVWNTEAWKELKDTFPDNNVGSRIMLTTRFKKVAGCGYHFQLCSLGNSQSWELFCKKIFGSNKCPTELEDLGKYIVQSCHGRPMLISLVACCLSASKMTVSRWSNMVSQIEQRSISKWNIHILTVCYRGMPQLLKTCFLYLGVFPEDSEIYVKQLIQLWIAEGLIQWVDNPKDRSIEDVAEDSLKGLIERNLIQVTRRRLDGGIKSCRVHDIMRDLCVYLSKEERFLEVHIGGDDHSTDQTVFSWHDDFDGDDDSTAQIKTQRLSIVRNCQDYISKSKTSDSSHVRSISCFSQDTRSVSEENWKLLFKHFPLLKVLNLGEDEVENKLPESIEELFHLRYLKVKSAKKVRIPKSIFNLRNLQTIDLRQGSLPKLPEGFWKMQQLRHLFLDGRSRLPTPKSEDHLPNLLTLSYISDSSMNGINISKKAPNLRKLGLYGYHQLVSKSEQQVLFNFQHLQSLKFAQECTFEDPILLPATINKITVKRAILQSNVIKMFGELPNLHILKLVQTNFENDELEVYGKYSFPELQLLKFENSGIVTWKLEKGAMPKLQRLFFSNCSQLQVLPAELWEGNTIQELELVWPSNKLEIQVAKDLKERKGKRPLIYPSPKITRRA
ncbi:putative late blight resistance protein homolog R1B-14 [Macadamia integrifolia]|uniref:putative late blight resistance protein homolog R1B-14 n=1 Tax=Macadamia integrifolia TaxID=60698 RepID=UPI001C532C1C|nr:putative late blight resistance protein homolog R1B-14 [Macadamia integrifolia]